MKNEKQHLKCLLLFIFHFSLFTFSSFSQTISATLDRDKILIGEQVTLLLKADLNERDYSLVNWYNFPDTVNHLEIINRGNIDTVDAGGSVSYVQKIIITSFDSGLWKLPLFEIALQDRSSGKQITIKADSLALQVLPVDISNMQDYHDIKNILDVPVKNNLWMIIAIAAAALIIIIIIVWWWLKKRKKKEIVIPKRPVIQGPPLDWAMEQLDALQKEDLPAKNQTKLFYTKLDEIYRTYFDEQLHIGSLQLTGDELMMRLKLYLVQESKRTKFYQLIRLCDAVKFAKYIPEANENNDAIPVARETIQYAEETIQQMRKNNAY